MSGAITPQGPTTTYDIVALVDLIEDQTSTLQAVIDFLDAEGASIIGMHTRVADILLSPAIRKQAVKEFIELMHRANDKRLTVESLLARPANADAILTETVNFYKSAIPMLNDILRVLDDMYLSIITSRRRPYANKLPKPLQELLTEKILVLYCKAWLENKDLTVGFKKTSIIKPATHDAIKQLLAALKPFLKDRISDFDTFEQNYLSTVKFKHLNGLNMEGIICLDVESFKRAITRGIPKNEALIQDATSYAEQDEEVAKLVQELQLANHKCKRLELKVNAVLLAQGIENVMALIELNKGKIFLVGEFLALMFEIDQEFATINKQMDAVHKRLAQKIKQIETVKKAAQAQAQQEAVKAAQEAKKSEPLQTASATTAELKAPPASKLAAESTTTSVAKPALTSEPELTTSGAAVVFSPVTVKKTEASADDISQQIEIIQKKISAKEKRNKQRQERIEKLMQHTSAATRSEAVEVVVITPKSLHAKDQQMLQDLLKNPYARTYKFEELASFLDRLLDKSNAINRKTGSSHMDVTFNDKKGKIWRPGGAAEDLPQRAIDLFVAALWSIEILQGNKELTRGNRDAIQLRFEVLPDIDNSVPQGLANKS